MLSGVTWIVVLMALAMGGFYLAVSLAQISNRRDVTIRLSRLSAPDQAEDTLLGRLTGLLERFGRWMEGAKLNGDLRALFLRAGLFQASTLYIFVALRYIFAVFVFITFVVVQGGFAPGIVDVALGAVLGYLTYRYALIGLQFYADRRADKIRRELPPVLDIMLMALDAGISIDQCMRYVTSVTTKTAPVTSAVLRRHIADIDGGMPYDAALDRLGQRLGLDEGQDLAATIKQALFQGGELGSTLRRFSHDLSEKRMALAREQVGRKGPQLSIVMILFFMPALLVVLAGPAVVDLTDALRGAGQRMSDGGGE